MLKILGLIPWFVEVKDCWHARETQLTNEDGGIQSCIPLFFFTNTASFLVYLWERFENYFGYTNRNKLRFHEVVQMY